ncbi:MAG: patatin-like phospholipase family protein [Muribaculaceae bacterium]|nr:patatin-like phospholipase family protein [Muribaculaceae bacterium]
MVKRFLVSALVALLGCATMFGVETPDSILKRKDKQQRVGLVLSGGGAKGIAHVGVIKALEDNDIPIDYVTGTSMGAIVGSLYSCGWSPEKMLKFFTNPDFLYWSSGVINPDQKYYLTQPSPTPKWLNVNINFRDTTTGVLNQILPSNLISPLPMNIEFLKIYGPYTLQCRQNFNNLFVPFRCVTSDVYHKRKIVLHGGSLGDAVRASMSFPFVFKPIEMDGVLVYDGGIYDNFPVNVMQSAFNPDFIIGVSVSGADKKPQPNNVYSQLEDMIIQNNDYSVPAKNGIKIQVPVLNFGVLDFAQAQTIYDIGYKTGMEMVDSIKKRIVARRTPEEVNARRATFAGKTPALKFDDVEVTGATGSQARYLKYLFDGQGKRPIGIERVEDAYYRAVTDGTLRNLLPQLEVEKDKRNMLLLEATLQRPWTIGVGGWITSTTNSMLYLDFGYHSLRYNSLDVSLSGWIGQSYLAGMLSGKFNLRTSNPSFIRIEGVMSRHKFYDSQLLFYQTSTPTFITETENYIRAGYEWAIGKRIKGYTNLAYGYMSDSYYPTNVTDFQNASKDKTQYQLGVFKAGVESNTLNDQLYPNEGYHWKTDVTLSYESSRYLADGNKALRTPYTPEPRAAVEAYWKQFFPVSKHFRIGTMANVRGTIQHLHQNYTASLIHAVAFAPTPSTQNYFNEAFRSDNYVAAGLIPVWNPVGKLQLRGDFYLYSPIRELRPYGTTARYEGWFRRAEFIGEVAAVYNFPFASLSLYGNYLSAPSHNWNFGISFGLLFMAPRLLR